MPRAAAAFAVAGLLLAPASAGALDPRVEARIAEYLEHHRDRLEHAFGDAVDVDGLVAEMDRRIRAGETPDLVTDWMYLEARKQAFAFAPDDPRPNDRYRYGLPYDGRFPRMLLQGNGQDPTHKGIDHYAFDFALPEGAAILAARPGRVARVKSGQTDWVSDTIQVTGNSVWLLHRDGSVGQYTHLQPEVPVHEGQKLRRGDLVGYCGPSARKGAPHVHFAVWRKDARGIPNTIGIRFDDGTRSGFLPARSSFYGYREPPTVPLIVYARGKRVSPDRPVRIKRGESVQLEVALPKAGGGEADVTRRPATSYTSLTPWTLDVTPAGRVTARPTHGYELRAVSPSEGKAGVLFHQEKSGALGYFDVPFRIRDEGG